MHGSKMNVKDSIVAPMPTLTLKGIPEDLMERLRHSADSDRRSVNQHAIHILDRALARQRPGDFKRFLDEFYSEWGPGDLTDKDFQGLRPADGFESDRAAGS
ncbi:MAG: hypothetical protein ACI80V_002037 [Rhodothermales bacterium]|jgi:hypothetical protein